MKKTELFFAVLSLAADVMLTIAAGIAAYYIRFQTPFTEIRPVFYTLPLFQFLKIVVVLSLLWAVLFSLLGLYRVKTQRLALQLTRVFFGASTGILTVILVIFFRKEELFSSRFIVLAFWILSIVFVSFGRIVIHESKKFLYRRNIGVRRMILVGNDRASRLLLEGVSKDTGFGVVTSKHYAEVSDEMLKEIETMCRQRMIDDLWTADASLSRSDIQKLKDIADEYHVTFCYAANLFDSQTVRLEVVPLNGVPIIEIKKTPLDGWGRVVKRMVDIFGSLFGIVIFSPVMLLTAVLIKLESKGPVIYKNLRVNKEGNFFTYKFRSMYLEHCTGALYSDGNAEVYEKKLIEERSVRKGPLYKIKHDPRKTRVGRFIDRYSIDELPQLFNVLFGSMSLVGPRPHQPVEVEQYQRHHKRVLALKPGMTGMAQISGRSQLDFEDEVRLDVYYIQNWSLWLDLYIMLRTPLVVLMRRSDV